MTLAPIIPRHTPPPKDGAFWSQRSTYLYTLERWTHGVYRIAGHVEHLPVTDPRPYRGVYYTGILGADPDMQMFADVTEAMTWVQTLERLEGP
jgi:hypothetical protein